MELDQVSGCEDTKCPKVYLSDRGTAVFVGTVLPAAESPGVGAGEQAVELPLSIVRDALDALAGGRQ
jgi:hypothetical protein